MSRSRRSLLHASLLGGALLGRSASAAGPDVTESVEGAIDVARFGAKGDGVTDDSAAIAAAGRFAVAQFAAGRRCFLKFGSGRFLLRQTPIPMFMGAPIGIRGEGPNQTLLLIDSAYRGDVFSWSNCWDRAAYGPHTRAKNFTAGVFVEDIGFVGALDHTTPYNALGFYDINDNVRVANVEFDYIFGSAITTGGVTRPGGFGIMRESRFSELRIFHSGTPDRACVEIGSSGHSDGTNELIFRDVDIFAPGGHGFVIRNAGTQPIRLIKIFGLRIEKVLGGYNGLQIGDEQVVGKIYGINASGLELVTCLPGSIALAVLGMHQDQVEACFLQGQIVNCKGDGITVTTGFGNRIEMLMNACLGTSLTLRRTKSPLYYFCPNIHKVDVAPESCLLVLAYVHYAKT